MADTKVTNAKPKDITPALANQVDFSSQIDHVTKSLESRTSMKKQLRDDWREIVKAFREHSVELPVLRQPLDSALRYLNSVNVYEPVPEADVDMQKLNDIDSDVVYYLHQLHHSPEAMELVEKAAPGITDLVRKANLYHERGSKKVDMEATKTARDEIRAKIEVMQEHLDELADTENTLNDVDKYIGTVEKIANISAVANGRK
jgi:hypothetical protein